MSETKRISPMLDNFDMGGPISDHDGVYCYPAMRKDSDDRYIVKTVSIPASQTQLDALLLTGAFPDAASALNYFKELADKTVEELEILNQLSHLEGFLPYESWQVNTKTDGIGFDVHMLSAYKRTLRKHVKKQPMTHLGAVNLGLDICTALAVCRRAGYLYVDLKPNNIYVLDEQQYRIGDLGFVAMDSLAYTSLPSRYHSEYTAPELEDALSSLNTTVDIYALGLILYQVYHGGALPEQTEDGKFAPPLHADYEMSEIILKACDPDPQNRWQDPIAMGQALVSYMQRNGANDTPIIAPELQNLDILPVVDDIDLTDIDLSDIPELEDDTDLLPEEIESSDISAVDNTADAVSALEQPSDAVSSGDAETTDDTSISDKETASVHLSSQHIQDDLSIDETAPENNIEDVDYNEITDELSQILAQADELVSHVIPEPAIAPEPAEIVLPEMPEAADIPAEADSEIPTTDTKDDDILNVIMAETQVVPLQTAPDDAEDSVSDDSAPDAETAVAENTPKKRTSERQHKKKKNSLQWLLNTIIIILILAILAVAFFYYKNIYLLPIDSIDISGDESSMVVKLDSGIDESLLSVVCSDSHGNQISAPVVNGTATFANLAPDTAYNIQVLADGFHRLTGETAASYSTPAQTKVVQFNAVTGSEDGSVILSFAVEGPDTGNWAVAYSAADEPEQTVDFLSHMTTLNGLTVGKDYTFTLVPGNDMYVTGETQITFKASALVFAQDVSIISCVDNQLTVDWTVAEDNAPSEWTVRCYDDDVYNETVITSDTAVVFENINPEKDYTVEVTAAGMSLSQRAYMTANAVTVTNFAVNASAEELIITWDSSYPAPDDGWVLLYTVDNSNIQSSMTCLDNRAVISPIVPDAMYNFTLQLANSNTVLAQPMVYETPAAKDFSGYGMIRSSMTFRTCKRPDKDDWKYKDVSDSDYTRTFQVGEKISIVGQLHNKYSISDDRIVITYVFTDADGNVVSYCYNESDWESMWKKYYGEFDVPQAPSQPGEYTLTLYFNGCLVTKKPVNITA